MGMIPKKTKSDIKIWHNLSLFKVIGFIMTIMITFVLSGVIFSGGALQTLFVFSCGLIYIVCNLKSPTNPNKIFLFGLIDFLKFIVGAKTIYGNQSEEYKYFKERTSENEKKQVKKSKSPKHS